MSAQVFEIWDEVVMKFEAIDLRQGWPCPLKRGRTSAVTRLCHNYAKPYRLLICTAVVPIGKCRTKVQER